MRATTIQCLLPQVRIGMLGQGRPVCSSIFWLSGNTRCRGLAWRSSKFGPQRGGARNGLIPGRAVVRTEERFATGMFCPLSESFCMPRVCCVCRMSRLCLCGPLPEPPHKADWKWWRMAPFPQMLREAPLESKVQGETAWLWLLDLLPTPGLTWSTTSVSPVGPMGRTIIRPAVWGFCQSK